MIFLLETEFEFFQDYFLNSFKLVRVKKEFFEPHHN